MLLVEEQRSLIEKIVRSDKNFSGNEDLFEDFCSEAFQKSYMVFNSSSNVQKIESYVTKVVHTSIVSVLKNSGRVIRKGSDFVPSKEIKVADFNPATIVKSDIVGPSFVLDFPDPKASVEETLITKECIRRIFDAVCVIHKGLPSQQFLEIFNLRYIKSLKQKEIAETLNLSQSEVSKRLMQLSKLISRYIDGGNS